MGLFNRDRSAKVVDLEIERINVNPYQPRSVFDLQKLEELSASIREVGLLQPIVVRRAGNRYELVAGERRLRASVMADLVKIPALVRDYSDEEIARAALIENIQRENLNVLEEARAYETLIRQFTLTQTELARQVGKSQSAVANKLRLLKLPGAVLDLLGDGVLSERHGRALLRLEDADGCTRTAEKAAVNGWSVRETIAYIDKLTAVKVPQRDLSGQKRRMIVKDVRIFFNTIQMALKTMVDAGVPAEMEERELPDGRREIVIRIDS